MATTYKFQAKSWTNVLALKEMLPDSEVVTVLVKDLSDTDTDVYITLELKSFSIEDLTNLMQSVEGGPMIIESLTEA